MEYYLPSTYAQIIHLTPILSLCNKLQVENQQGNDYIYLYTAFSTSVEPEVLHFEYN